jgi:uncharacterized protein
MSLSEIQFPEENPFYRIKVRQIFLWYVLFVIIIGVGYGTFFGAIAAITKSNFTKILDPIIVAIAGINLILLLGAWLRRQCNLVGIDIKWLIGKIPRNYKWLTLIKLIAARYAFNIGISQIVYCFISFFAYSWVEKKLKFSLANDSFLKVLSTTFSPALLLFLSFVVNLITLAYFIFLIFGIVLHRWSTKWGTKRTILYFCIFFGIISLLNGNFLFILALYIVVEILLYLQTRTLVVVGVAYLIDIIIGLLWNYSGISNYDLSLSLVEQLRDRVWIGIIFLAISTPILVRFIYQNWHRIDEPLPYFTNSSQ